MQFANSHYSLMLCASTRRNKPYTLSTNGSMAEARLEMHLPAVHLQPPRTIEPLRPSLAAKTLFLLTSSIECLAHNRQYLIYSTQQPHTPEPLTSHPFILDIPIHFSSSYNLLASLSRQALSIISTPRSRIEIWWVHIHYSGNLSYMPKRTESARPETTELYTYFVCKSNAIFTADISSFIIGFS